jgi:hypothetical protein
MIRGNGPREGELMGFATITKVHDDGGLDFEAEYGRLGADRPSAE